MSAAYWVFGGDVLVAVVGCADVAGWVGLGRVTDAGFDAPVAAAAAAATRQRLVRASRYIVVRLALMRHSWECEQPLDG